MISCSFLSRPTLHRSASRERSVANRLRPDLGGPAWVPAAASTLWHHSDRPGPGDARVHHPLREIWDEETFVEAVPWRHRSHRELLPNNEGTADWSPLPEVMKYHLCMINVSYANRSQPRGQTVWQCWSSSHSRCLYSCSSPASQTSCPQSSASLAHVQQT